MADRLLLRSPRLRHSFLNAMCIAGLALLIQFGAVAMALLKRPSGERFSLRAPSTELPAAAPIEVVSHPEGLAKGDSAGSSPGGEDRPPAAADRTPALPPDRTPTHSAPNKMVRTKAPDLSVIKDQVGIIQDPLLARLVQSGVGDRKQGNYEGALNAFLDAEAALAGHPVILAEIAATYQEMGQLSEAQTYWEKVRELGPVLGGGYYQAADRILRGDNPFPVAFGSNQWVKLGEVQTEKNQAPEEGERVKLTIPILGNVRQSPDGTALRPQVADLKVKVYCYDLINGKDPGPTTAEITQNFPSKPYDWADDATEWIEVIYHQPASSLDDRQIRGSRVYYGHVIDVYYGGVLQDSVESAPELRRLRFPLNEMKEDPPLPKGPDGSLFPR